MGKPHLAPRLPRLGSERDISLVIAHWLETWMLGTGGWARGGDCYCFRHMASGYSAGLLPPPPTMAQRDTCASRCLRSLGASSFRPGHPPASAPGLRWKVAENPIEVHWLLLVPCGWDGAMQGAKRLGEGQRARRRDVAEVCASSSGCLGVWRRDHRAVRDACLLFLVVEGSGLPSQPHVQAWQNQLCKIW